MIKSHFNEEELINRYNKGEAINCLRYEYHSSYKSIIEVLTRHNILIRNRSSTSKKYHIDENIFEKIDSEEKAYWLGFLYADGNIYKTRLQLVLAAKDTPHTEKFLKFLKSSHRLYPYKGNSQLQITNNKIVNDLKNLGVVPRKSLILKFPNNKQVPKNLIRHFIRGYFDGDGSISLNKYSNPKYKNMYWNLNFTGTPRFLHAISNYLTKEGIPQKIPKLDKRCKSNKVSYLFYSGNKHSPILKIFYEYLYGKELEPICLLRKKEKFHLLF